MKNINIEKILLLAILLLAIFLRFYHFPNRYGLGEETVRDAVVAIEGARELQAPLTGSFSSLGPFTFGPWYDYQLTIFYLIFPWHYSPWLYLSLISVFYIFLIYKVGELLISKKFGLLLAFIAAISPAQIMSATHLTNPNMTNIFAIMTIWIFLKLTLKNLSYWWGFFLGIVLGIGINLHYQMVGLFILPIILLFYKPRRYPYFINSIIGIFMTFLPMLFFELTNHWFNVRNMIYYFLHGKDVIYVPNRWLFYVRDFWPAFWADSLGIPIFFGGIIMILSLIIFLQILYKRKLPTVFLLLLICFIFNFILLRYYWGQRFYSYLNWLRPLVFIFTGFTLFSITKIKFGKYIAFVLFGLIVITALPRIRYDLGIDGFSSVIYNEWNTLNSKYPTNKFTFYRCSNHYNSSYDSKVYSMVFILDKNKKLSNSGLKIGFKTENCAYPKSSFSPIATSSGDMIEKIYPIITEKGIIDLSKATPSALLEAGWKPVNFKTIYELNTRWWFKEQP